jgi:hypothetical protein
MSATRSINANGSYEFLCLDIVPEICQHCQPPTEDYSDAITIAEPVITSTTTHHNQTVIVEKKKQV